MPATQPQLPPLPPPPCRRIRTAPQLCQFLAAVIPQDPPAAPGTAAAAAAASALPASRLAAANNPLAAAAALAAAAEVAPVGARKRKLNSLLEEVSMGWCDATDCCMICRSQCTSCKGQAATAPCLNRLPPAVSFCRPRPPSWCAWPPPTAAAPLLARRCHRPPLQHPPPCRTAARAPPPTPHPLPHPPCRWLPQARAHSRSARRLPHSSSSSSSSRPMACYRQRRRQ